MRKRLSTLILLMLVLIALNALLLAQTTPQPTGGQPWDLRNITQTGQFTFYDEPSETSTMGKPLDIGDFDGNGCGDIAITGQLASHPVAGWWRGSGGHVRMVMNLCPITGYIDISSPNPPSNVFTIYGAYEGDMAGTETYIADFNGDGYDDLIFSAQNSDGPDQRRSNAGAVYILFGGPDFANHDDVDLMTPPADLLTFYGADMEDRLGLWVEGGDFDGDGYDDALVGANQADGIDNLRANAGEVWIFYGAADMFGKYGTVVDLTQPPTDATRIIGADYDDLLGSTVWGDDLDGDGYDDAIVSAGLWRASAGVGGLSFGGGDGPGNTRYNSGESFVIFGSPDLRGQTIDLATKMDAEGRPVDESISVVYGRTANDLLGEEICVGDMDGDGRHDLILGTLIGDGPERNMDEAGEAWIIYTHDPVRGQLFDMASPEPGRTVVIYPDQTDSKAGDTLRAYDLNGDGSDDLFYGAPDYDPTGYDGRLRHNAGMLAVIMGQRGGLPNDNGQILLFDPPEGLAVRFFIGNEDNDMMPYALAVYDVNGDGVLDIAPNAMGGDGWNNQFINAGEIYVVDGAEFLSAEHNFTVGMPTQAAVTPTATVPLASATPYPLTTASASGEGDVAMGRLLFVETCAGCHGFVGEGIAGLGLPLAISPLVIYATDAELLDFLKIGRPAEHPDNVTGVTMPASGGRTDWSDQDLMDVIAYLRQLRDYAPQ